jgi:tRNA threonylcarbamoyladenosine biosynthesis protein TsaB
MSDVILALDTATRWTGLALHDGKQVIAEQGWRGLHTQTVELTPAIGQLLARSNVNVADLRAVTVAIGPGSYTSLRVGLAVAKGLSLVVVAEAGRKRIIAGMYRWQEKDGWQASERPIIETWETLLFHLETSTTFAGEITPEAAKLIRASRKPFYLVPAAASVRRAGFLAEIGWGKIRQGLVDDAASLSPTYLRDPSGK